MNRETNRSAVVLLSGGLDSATVLAMAKDQGFVCHALTFDYGQRHRVELAAAERVAEQLGAASLRTAVIDRAAFEGFSGSALTDDVEVPKDRSDGQMTEGIPVTYVPARNTLFLSYALALAEVMGSGDIFIGVNAVDYSGYPDCRPQFIEAFTRMANLATKAGVEGRTLHVHAPLMHLSKVEIIRRGLDLGVNYALTHSCYDPAVDPTRPLGYRPCARCDACLLRKRAFEAMGMVDPVLA